jgi:hypothetical protein
MHRQASVAIRLSPYLLLQPQLSMEMQLNASSFECEFKEFACSGFNNVAFGCVNDKFHTVTQEYADTTQYKLSLA